MTNYNTLANPRSPHDDYAYASFTPDGGTIIYIPIEEAEKEGKARDHVHIFPHSRGGLPEKLGADLYIQTLKCMFDVGFEEYPGNYPDDLDRLEAAFEDQVSGDLMVPGYRTPMRAYCRNWKRTFKAKMLSGETVSLTFIQDKVIADKLVTRKTANLAADNLTFQQLGDSLPEGASLFAQIDAAVGAVLGFLDTPDQYGSIGVDLVARVSYLCANTEISLPGMGDPANWPLIDAFKDVWASSVALMRDIQQRGDSVVVQYYIVPNTMSVSQISNAIFGDSTHADDIIAMNQIDDMLSVPATTQIAYYDPSAQ